MDTRFKDDFSQEVWAENYKNHADTTVDDTLRRVATAVASVEKTDDLKQVWSAQFYELLTGFKLCAGGRIIANAGTDWKGVTLMNCFVGPKPTHDQDSLEGILGTLLMQAQTLKSEGGWGMNFSFIRPRGSFIHGIGVESPGSVKYMEIFDKSSDVITAGSGKKKIKKEGKTKIRKGAMMGVLDVWHPDIEEFITAKLPYQDENGATVRRLQKFNLSVNVCNEFMDRVATIKEIQVVLDSHLAAKNPPADHIADCRAMLEEAEKWDLIFPETSFPKYKAEWDGNITAWKAKGYPVKVFKTVKVSELWELIMRSTYTRNDPGVLFMDRANQTHCYNYGQGTHIAATNPCGEQCLPFGFVCNLASLNLTQFVTGEGTLDIAKIQKYVTWAVRFLDNVNDLTKAPLPQYEDSIKNARRIGLGVMGWGSALYMMKLRFGSDEAEALKKTMMRVITHTAIEASVDLAIEKGAFKGCDFEKHANHSYFKSIGLPQNLIESIRKYGIRNSSLFSIQPTGNTGVFANVVSGGLEPVFSHEYIRTVIVNGCPDHLLSVTPKYWEGEFKETSMFKWVDEGNDKILRGVDKDGTVYKIDKNRGLTKEVPCIDYGVRWLREKGEWNPKADWAVTTSELKVEDHVRDLTGFGAWIDSSMSKTVNVPNNYSYESFKDLYLNAYKSGVLKGITTYREGTMTNVLAVKKEVLPKSTAPKRPKILPGELHHFQVGGKKYYVCVGLYGDNKEPYEVFTGVNEIKREVFIPKNIKVGRVRKDARGKYIFIGDDKEDYALNNGHADDTADALTRMISTSLRHGADISFIVQQLEKTKGDIMCFSKVLARALKKYIKDGTLVSGEECPVCSGKMVRKEGCSTCQNCAYSKCG